ncbi:Uncharacterised protein [Mycobacteroides abscessus subsp. abscessus]|nr:Uncharacterised protein [Mycobacteroides abscessus]SLI68860.1 Uncharacterised protein [Mycobacteroides abscessus subsp. abscessus]
MRVHGHGHRTCTPLRDGVQGAVVGRLLHQHTVSGFHECPEE